MGDLEIGAVPVVAINRKLVALTLARPLIETHRERTLSEIRDAWDYDGLWRLGQRGPYISNNVDAIP